MSFEKLLLRPSSPFVSYSVQKHVRKPLPKATQDARARARRLDFLDSLCKQPPSNLSPAENGTFAHEEMQKVVESLPLGLQIKLKMF